MSILNLSVSRQSFEWIPYIEEDSSSLIRWINRRAKRNIKNTKHKLTFAGWPLGLGNELEQSSSLIRDGKFGKVGVKGWQFVVWFNDEGGVDSSSLWRSFIFCNSSFKYSIASPSIDARSICKCIRKSTCR